MEEVICEVYWKNAKPVTKSEPDQEVVVEADDHALYALFGTHPLYGSNVLLYIGMTTQGSEIRLSQHAWWTDDELDDMTAKVGLLIKHKSVEVAHADWKKNPKHPEKDTKTLVKDETLIQEVESLLIYAHQPAFNSSKKVSLKVRKGLRVFNSGKRGLLHPELSWAYFSEA